MSLKITINNEEVVCNNNIQIKEEMLSTSSTILKNCYPKTWELDKDYVSRYYFPKDYSKCKITEDTFHPEQVGITVKDSNINLNYNSSLNKEVKGLYGDTFQNAYTGKNLCGIPEQTVTKSGVTITIKDGEITLNGTSTGGTQYLVPIDTTTLNGNYTMNLIYISGSTGGSSNKNFNIRRVSDDTIIQGTQTDIRNNNANKQISISGATSVKFGIYMSSGSTFTNYKFKPQLVQGTSPDYNYEPYVGGVKSPNPSYPQAIENVTGLQTITRCGKNLFDKDNTNYLLDNVSINANTGIVSAANGFYTLKIPCKPNTTYTVSKVVSSRFTVGYSNNLTYTSGEALTYFTVNNTATNITITTGNEAKSLYVFYSKLSAETTYTLQQILDSVQIEENNQATTYESYAGQTYEVNLGKNLFGGFTYTNIDYVGISFTYNNNGTILIDGTNNSGTTAYSMTTSVSTPYQITLLPGIYTISGGLSNAILQVINSSGSLVSETTSSVFNTTFTLTQQTKIYVRVRVANGISFSNQTINIMLEKGTQATSYSPYFTPIELNKIGDYQDKIYKNMVAGSGKNKLDISQGYQLGYLDNTGTLVEDNMVATFNQYIPVEESQKYCLSLDWVVDNLYFYTYDASSTFIQKYQYSNLKEKSLIIPSGVAFIRVGVEDGIDAITTQLLEEMKLMVEIGETRSSYEPYLKPDTWYLKKQTRKLKLKIADMNNSGNFPGWKNQTQLKNDWPNINTQYLYNTGFKYLSSISVQPSSGYDTLGMNTSGSSSAIYLNKNYFSLTQTQWKEQYPNLVVTIMYALATPEYTEITNEELINSLESVNNINLQNGINNIVITSADLPMLMELHYNFKEAYTEEDLLFCGCVKNTGNISLNPREPHYVNLQVLDFKVLLSEGETLNYVINGKTIVETINQVVASISDYGFVVGNIQILNPNDIINAYSTLNKTAYDVFQYIADITQSRWTTRMIDENTIAIDFYDPTLMPTANPIESTQEYVCQNKINNITFNYSTNDYRNKQIMTSDEVFGNITQTETIIADGYTKNFMCENKIGTITEITVNGVAKTFITKSEQELGASADFVYQPGDTTFNSSSTIGAGNSIVITYYPIVKGREIILNSGETTRIGTQIGRKGTLSRYENRNDTTSSAELQKIGQSYIKYKGQAEISLKVVSENNLFNVGQIVNYNAPLEELSTEYMVKSKQIDWYPNIEKSFYTFELTNNFNYENAVNYFDNQRAKSQGNIGEGETITRNIDLESIALIKLYDTEIEEVQIQNPTSLDFSLDGVII